MQSQVGLPLVFQYNTTGSNATQSHHNNNNNVSLFGGGQKASYFTSNGVQQQHHYGETSFSSLSSQSVKVQPPLSSYNSMSLSTSSSSSASATHSSVIQSDAHNLNGMMLTPAEHYEQSMQQGYESFR